MVRYIIIALTTLSFLSATTIDRASARPPGRGERCGIGFYNTENLYDTLPSPFYNDSDYTPQGRNKWGKERYQCKLSNLAKVIDAMQLDILALAEVESEQAVRDLVTSLHTDYNYIHRTSSDSRGMDVALLYKGDKFIPSTIRQIRTSASRELLYIKGELQGVRLDIVVCHMPSAMNSYHYRARALSSLHSFVDSLQTHDFEAQLIVMGDFNANPTDRIMRTNFATGKQTMDGMPFLYNPFQEHYKRGFGTHAYDGKWNLYDNIFLGTCFIGSRTIRYLRSGIFVRDYLLQRNSARRQGYPLRTFSSGSYLGGYSDHLPVFVYLELF